MKKRSDKKSGKPSVTRRDFLKESAQLGIGALALSTGCASTGILGSRKIASENDPTPELSQAEIYDYIVVGSGAGGGPLACRLALAGKKVALIEAGSDYKSDLNPEVDKYTVPGFHPLSTEEPGMCWSFWANHYRDAATRERDKTNYDPSRQGILYPRAGTLGGCTAHNALFTLYPDAEDWQRIYELSGKISGKPDPSWQPREMMKYFSRMERCHYLKHSLLSELLPDELSEPLHGWDGWLSTEVSNYHFAIQDPQIREFALAAAKVNGDEGIFSVLDRAFKEGVFTYSSSLDPNNKGYVMDKKNGIFMIPKATIGGKRRGTREFIKRTAMDHPGLLTVKKEHLVSELLFDATDPSKVIGVYCYRYAPGKPVYAADPRSSVANQSAAIGVAIKARKEVILAGGAFNSPQLLMLSGIGDPNVLEPILNRSGRKMRVPLPGVGKNLQDRYEVGVITQVDSDFKLLNGCSPGTAGDPCLAKYRDLIGPKDSKTGEEKGDASSSPYSTNGAVIAMIRRSTPDKTSPDLCIFGVPGYFAGYHQGYSQQAYRKAAFTWTILKGHTENTAGEVTLNSPSPFDQPTIQFNSFDEGNAPNGDDADCVVTAIKLAREINGEKGIMALAQKPGSVELVPGVDIASDVQIKQWVKDNAWGHHASCTNKMGDIASDPNAVVDTDFRVHKVKRLRIVDASVFPRIPGLYIVVPIYMISEKAADAILADDPNTQPSFL